jgi:hypothetical protein
VEHGLLWDFAGRCIEGRALKRVCWFRSVLLMNRMEPEDHVVSVRTVQGGY